MATLLKVPRGISSTSVVDVPDQWNAEWFRKFIRTQLGNADIRNASVGSGNIVITGSSTKPATIDVGPGVKGIFNEPFALAAAPSDAVLTNYRVMAPQAGVLTIGDGGATANLTIGVAANGIGNSQLRQSVAKSVIGNATNAVGNVADIVSSTLGDVLWNSTGSALSFGPLTQLGAVTVGTWNATTIDAAHGGTGQNAYAVGDLLYASAANALSRLADIASGSYLRSGGVGAAPVWSTVTLPNAAALGDIVYASATNTYADLAGNITAAKQFLTQTGTGAVSAAPAWAAIAASDLPGSFSGFANPTAKIGLSVVNGVATTAMRSDAAQQLDVAIVPTWTGAHTHAPAAGTPISVTAPAGALAISLTGASTDAARFGLTDGNVGNKQYQLRAGAIATGVFDLFDATAGASRVQVSTTGAVTVLGRLGTNNASPPAQVVGFGTPTGTGVIASFPGATAALAQCSQAIAQLITDLKAFGLYGT